MFVSGLCFGFLLQRIACCIKSTLVQVYRIQRYLFIKYVQTNDGIIIALSFLSFLVNLLGLVLVYLSAKNLSQRAMDLRADSINHNYPYKYNSFNLRRI